MVVAMNTDGLRTAIRTSVRSGVKHELSLMINEMAITILELFKIQLLDVNAKSRIL